MRKNKVGFNSTIIVMNDALHEIKEDPDFGRKVYEGISKISRRNGFENIRSGCFGNAATVIETHHADQQCVVSVGGNTAEILGYSHWRADALTTIRDLAREFGYGLRKLPKKNT